MHDQAPEFAAAVSDRYRIERRIGQGGMATVFLATDLKHEREVALKVLRPELGAVLGSERFLAEVKITARLDHPHILTLIDSGEAGGMLYYVLPYVRGESLRDLLDRERQLGVEQALAITRQVASALDYAHRKGVVHRDIKPENILLQEGEAMLADFGIALAVQESGGGRLTETGLSLGTPFYMSPEQASGERNLDARSDLYSLASVLYEMLVGEPPMTGKTVQAVIAKLLSEPAMHVRTVRPTVPVHVDAAVARALSKVPADRFASVAEFVRALEAAPPAESALSSGLAPGATTTARGSRRRAALVGVAAAVVTIGAVASLAARGRFGGEGTSAALRERTQLTSSGAATAPAISADGKQLAYFEKRCEGAECRFALVVQDVGGTESRRLLEGATAAYWVGWSPDRRNLLMNGTIDGRYGTFVISALGGTPRYVGPAAAAFFAGGDSLLIGGSGASDSSFLVRVAGLDGTVRDSLRVPGPGVAMDALIAIPGTSRFVALVIQPPRGLWQVLDRSGKVTDRLLNACTCGGAASGDALWMMRAGPSVSEAVVRVALDGATGRLAARQDTIFSGRFSSLSVTSDGTRMAVNDGTYAFRAIAGELPDLLAGRIPAGAPLLESSTPAGARLSPDGRRLLLVRVVPGPSGNEMRMSVRSFEGGAEAPLAPPGHAVSVDWADSVTVLVQTATPGRLHAALVDVRTGATGRTFAFPDSLVEDVAVLPDGWAWIPRSVDRIVVDRGGQRRELRVPRWFDGIFQINASPDGTRLLYTGWNASTNDTLGVDVVPVSGGAPVAWARTFAEQGSAQWLDDGSIAFSVWRSSDAVDVRHFTGPGQARALGTIGHVANRVTLSRDLKRATVMWREYRGDAWVYEVVKR